jgi:uncharacterized protein (DUF1800 family)
VADQPGTWTEAHVRRLFWRAGFGAAPDEAARWTERGKAATIAWLLDGDGASELAGPAPRIALDPVNEWGHDLLWWLDRMVRTRRPLVEKLTLFWHDHFATLDQDTPLMLAQNRMLRKRCLGSFRALLGSVTRDPAMLLFLSLADSDKSAPNENYARELMELFTLGRGYTERDIREAARALTGFRARWGDDGFGGIYYDRAAHDGGIKRIFGKSGRYDWRGVLDLVCRHREHAPFLVGKLWSFFITEPLPRATRDSLARTYRRSGLRIKPVVEAILGHPALYAGLDRPAMVKCPAVFLAGALRSIGRGMDTDDWTWISSSMDQMLFSPPSVAGWEWGPAWLSTNTMRWRFVAVTYLMEKGPLKVEDRATDAEATVAEMLVQARRATGDPWTSPETDAALERMAERTLSGRRSWEHQERADMCQRSLRHLLLSGPDAQLH